jgi:hypothetical protein
MLKARRRFLAGLAAAAAGAACQGWSFAATPGRILVGHPGNYRELLRQLGPGDTLVLEPGAYRDTLPLHGMRGEPGRPIVVRGPGGDRPAVLLGRSGRNTVSLKDTAHVEIHGLVLDGQGLEVDGVKAEGTAAFVHHVTLSDLIIVNHGVDQATIGISAHCPCWGWAIRNNVIDGAGTGMYLGRPDDRGAFVGGLIEGNIVRNTLGYNVQIKHQRLRQSVPGMPQETLRTVIRRNVFSKGPNASIAERARPNLLVGHFPATGPGSDDMYLIYANVFHDNPTEALFQGEGNVALYNNVFVNPHGPGVHVQPHNGAPRVVRVFQNTVVTRGTGIRVHGMASGFVPMVSTNAVFADTPLRIEGGAGPNRTGSYDDAALYLRAPYGLPPFLDVSPSSQGALALAEAPSAELADFPERDRDVLGGRRPPGIAGAIGFRPGGAPIRLDAAPPAVHAN